MKQKLKFAIFIPNTFYFNFIIYASIPKPLRRKRSNFDLIGIWGSKKCVKVKSFAPRQIQRRLFAALVTLSRKVFRPWHKWF